MQSLRHASRRALQIAASGHDTCVGFVRAYSAIAPRKSKEERYELVMQFVDKFKASNNGELPGISLLRKEVGGKYDILKEILQGLQKAQDEPAKAVELKKVEEENPEDTSPTEKKGLKKPSKSTMLDLVKEKKSTKEVLKDQLKRSSPPVKMDLKGKKIEPNVSKSAQVERTVDVAGSQIEKADDIPDSKKSGKDGPDSRTSLTDASVPRMAFKDPEQKKPPLVSVKDGSISILDTFYSTDEDDDDSDVAAPEYSHRPSQTQTEGGLKAAKMKESKIVKGEVLHLTNDSKSKTSDPKALDGDHSSLKLTNDSKSKASDVKGFDGDWNFGSPWRLPNTSVARIMNLPMNMTTAKIKSICEDVGSVNGLEMRRGSIADVHFNVKDNNEMKNIIDRLRNVLFGQTKARIFPTQRFFSGNNVDNRFKVQDADQLKIAKENLFQHLEHRIKYFKCQVQDYRGLLAMKGRQSEHP